MTKEQVAKIFNEGECERFRETEKHEFYLKLYNNKYYIVVFLKNRNGDKIIGCFSEEDFLNDVKLLKRAFSEM